MQYGKEKSDQVAASPKKVYRTPKLTVHGTVKKITAAAAGKTQPGGPDVFQRSPFSR